jgi:F-type H+-transporting ATPase subunit delta
MNVSPVAYRYARSLMQLARERNEVEAVREDMQLVAATCAASQPLRLMLNSPVVKADRKTRMLGRIFGGRIGHSVERFINILVRKGREGMLPEIAEGFQNAYRAEQGILVAEVRSAVPLDDEARVRVKKMAEERFPGKTIELQESVDPALIGGLVLRVGDEQVDASVSRRLRDLRRKFSENPYIPEI